MEALRKDLLLVNDRMHLTVQALPKALRKLVAGCLSNLISYQLCLPHSISATLDANRNEHVVT